MIQPPPLKEDDTIGVISPASPVPALRPERFERGISTLEEMGFRVLVGKNARAIYGHTAGTIDQRVADLHSMFADESVRAIICSIGGYNSNQLLGRLDYGLIGSNPKILVGYSDPTFLLLGIHTLTNLVTFLGPTVMPQFGEKGGLHPYTEHWFRKVLMNPDPAGELYPSGVQINEYLEWDRDDTRPRQEASHDGPKTLKPGRAEGHIVAGHLGTLLALVGTPYFPDLEGAILCVEVSDEETLPWVDRQLSQLRLMGAFEKIAALVVGRFHPASGFTDEDSPEKLLESATAGYDLPVALGFDFGHTDPMFTLPIGVRATVDFTGEHPNFEILEGGISTEFDINI